MYQTLQISGCFLFDNDTRRQEMKVIPSLLISQVEEKARQGGLLTIGYTYRQSIGALLPEITRAIIQLHAKATLTDVTHINFPLAERYTSNKLDAV